MKYLDVNVFAYPVIYQTGKESEAAARILEKVVMGEIPAATSLLAWNELSWAVWKSVGIQDAKNEGAKLLRLPRMTFLDLTPTIVLMAQGLMEKNRLQSRDALHAATALWHRIPEIVSFDAHFDGIPGLRRIIPE